MRTRSVVAGIAIIIVGTLVMFGHARAQDEPYPVNLKVGETCNLVTSRSLAETEDRKFVQLRRFAGIDLRGE
jgi:hypothetical protein